MTRLLGGLTLLLLVVALFLTGGGFTTLWFGLLAGIAVTQITAPPTRWRTTAEGGDSRLQAHARPGRDAGEPVVALWAARS